VQVLNHWRTLRGFKVVECGKRLEIYSEAGSSDQYAFLQLKQNDFMQKASIQARNSVVQVVLKGNVAGLHSIHGGAP
jgi:hypothetical protein